MRSRLKWLALGLLLTGSCGALAQDNYEIQVYGAETVAPGSTMLEFHTNYTANGRRFGLNGVSPTEHAVHETVEITHGFTDWFETGFYIFTSAGAGQGWAWVGDHVRPRFRIPERWHWPVGVSLSTEIGYQRPLFSEDTWTLEIRPIVDKQLGRWYLAVNPAFERSLAGLNTAQGFAFSPNAKISYELLKQADIGLEYYGGLGPVTGLNPLAEQQQQIFPAVDLNLSPRWEVNFGVGVGVTRSTDHLIVKTIIGYRFDRLPLMHKSGWGRHQLPN